MQKMGINTVLVCSISIKGRARQCRSLDGLVPSLLLTPLLFADGSRVSVPEHECGGALVSSSLLRDHRWPRKKKLETPDRVRMF